MTSTREERPLRALLLIAFLNTGLGIFFLVTALNRPSIANMRSVDLILLLSTGAILGVALAALFMYLVGRFKRAHTG